MKRIYLVMAFIAMIMLSCVQETEKAIVETKEVTDVTSNSARVVCNVSDDGAEVSSRGVCWDKSDNLAIETASSMGAGSGIGNYECEISGLESGTTYYVRAYATNSAGISYGEQKEFTTLDVDGGNEDNYDSGEIAGHEFVDLGLPSGLKWATCNVGASSPEDYGDYFAWGETSPKAEYTEENSVTYGLSISELQTQGYIDNEGNLTSSYDAATVNWGGSWRMPTREQMLELVEHCEWEWTQVNGVDGAKVTGPNGNSIFLPAAGDRYGSSLYYAGEYGFCWNSTPDESNSNSAYGLYFNSSYQGVTWYNRLLGQSVRPVAE